MAMWPPAQHLLPLPQQQLRAGRSVYVDQLDQAVLGLLHRLPCWQHHQQLPLHWRRRHRHHTAHPELSLRLQQSSQAHLTILLPTDRHAVCHSSAAPCPAASREPAHQHLGICSRFQLCRSS